MVNLIRLLSILLLFGSVAMLVLKVWRFQTRKASRQIGEAPRKPRLIVPIVGMIMAGLLIIVMFFGGAAQISSTAIGVAENTVEGAFYTLKPGTHIWPFSQNVTPFITKITVYDTRDQIIEIGEAPEGATAPEGMTLTQIYGVPAGSNSPGQPIVFFNARGWARVNPDKIIELHRRFGPTYLNTWVEHQWVTTLKAMQGTLSYDFVKKSREDLQNLVEKSLQQQLLDADEKSLVIVRQLTIKDYDYEGEVNTFLAGVAGKEFERQKAEQQFEVNKKLQESAKVEADTNFFVTKRNAEAEQAKLIAEATGRAEAVKVEADADAYATRVRYEAEATGLGLVQSALAKSPAAYLEYQKTLRWNGVLPTNLWAGASVPFLNVPMNQASPAPTTAPAQ